MVFRLTWVTSAALLGLVILRLSRLFLSNASGLPWQAVALIAAALGAMITWVSLKARFGTVTLLAAHLLLFGLFAFLYVGGDLSGSAVPPAGVAGDILSEISDALSIFRYSSPPVTPLAGIVALAAMMVWALSAVAAWGLLNNAPYLSIVPPVVFYLQLAVIDRQNTSMLWTTVLLLLVGAGLASIASDQRSGGGHAGHGRQAARIKAFAVPVLAIVGVTAVSVLATRSAVNADAVPSTGLLDWTNRSGSGVGGGGSVSYNPFIDVRRSVVSNSETPVFSATVSGDIANNQIYWRLLTMDTFNGDWWYASRNKLEDLDETGWETDAYAFRGETVQVTQDIVIQDLGQDVLPAAYSPIGVFSEERLIDKTTRVDPVDGSLHINGQTSKGMTYRITSLIPVVDAAVLAADSAGGLSPLFDAAAQEGRFQPVPIPSDPGDTPRDLPRYLQLPDGLDPTGELRDLAEEITLGLDTDYEKALALEVYFRNPNPNGDSPATQGFRYSANVAPNERDSGILDWLLNPASPGYHTGYCEQFSANMGALARILGIPTRTVLGFTPGEVRSNGTVLVKDRNAHAWVEVWLPAQGWVRFDPTPRGDGVNPTTFQTTGLSTGDLNRYFDEIAAAALQAERDGGGGSTPRRELDPGDLNRITPGGQTGSGGGGFSLPSWLEPAVVLTLAGAVGLGTVPAIKRRRRRGRLHRLEAGDISAAWAEIVDRLIDSGIGLNSADTPIEVAQATAKDLYPLATVYSRSIYGPDEPLSPDSQEAATSSLVATEDRLRSRETRWQRIRRTYRVRSLLPEWIKRSKSG